MLDAAIIVTAVHCRDARVCHSPETPEDVSVPNVTHTHMHWQDGRTLTTRESRSQRLTTSHSHCRAERVSDALYWLRQQHDSAEPGPDQPCGCTTTPQCRRHSFVPVCVSALHATLRVASPRLPPWTEATGRHRASSWQMASLLVVMALWLGRGGGAQHRRAQSPWHPLCRSCDTLANCRASAPRSDPNYCCRLRGDTAACVSCNSVLACIRTQPSGPRAVRVHYCHAWCLCCFSPRGFRRLAITGVTCASNTTVSHRLASWCRS